MKPPTPGRRVVADKVEVDDPDDLRDSRGKGFCNILPILSVNCPEGESGDNGHVGSGAVSENTEEARLDVVLA